MRHKYAILLTVFGAVVLADQVTKYLAVEQLTRAFEHAGLQTRGDRLRGFVALKNLDNDPPDPDGADLRLPPKVVVAGFWAHKYVENPGAAWGLLGKASAAWRVPFFHVISLLAIGIILAFFRRLEADQRVMAVALSMVLGGALGNYTDRVLRGYVIDFIDWHWRDRPGLHWPTFNLADAAICVGVFLMLAETLFAKRLPVEDEGLAPALAGAGQALTPPEAPPSPPPTSGDAGGGPQA